MSPEKPQSAATTRPTLRTIAQAAGTSLTTTSMALRNHPGISIKMREHVQAVARNLNYRPDPKLATLMQHLRMRSGIEYHETVAYLSPYPNYQRWKAASQHDYYLGAAERALELGYRVEIFHLQEPGMTLERMSDLLQARGIRGLLVGGSRLPNGQLDLDWSRFAAVTFSYSLISPILHRVTTDYYREMLSTLNRLRQEGCRKIGLNVMISNDEKAFNLWRSAYLFYQDELPKEYRIPINATSDGRRNLAEWVTAYQPDAIISAGCDFPKHYEIVYSKAPPHDIRYVNMNIFNADARSRGIDQDSYAVGRLALSHLVTMLQRNEIGLPQQPQVISIEGKWVEDYNAWRDSFNRRVKSREPCR